MPQPGERVARLVLDIPGIARLDVYRLPSARAVLRGALILSAPAPLLLAGALWR